MIREFKGFNHNPVIGDGEFYQQENISSDAYPLLSCRENRAVGNYIANPVDMSAAEHMAWISNGAFYYNGEMKFAVEARYGDGTHMVRMGAYICIFPQGIVYNTHDDTWEQIGIHNESKKPADGSANVSVQIVYPVTTASGEIEWETPAGGWTESDTDPSTDTTANGDWWLNTSVRPSVLYRWSESQQMWVSVSNAYLAVKAAGVADGIKVGDGIHISGIEDYTEADGSKTQYAYLNGTYAVEGFWMNDYIVLNVPYLPVLGMAMGWTTGDIVVERKLPQMDYVCEMGNRLYGCSSDNHEIYASKLGDPLNWNVFQGVATDSYAATIGSPGDFTGCIGYRNNVLFFKEDCIHILSGTRPATYQIDTLECNGVQRYSGKSLCIVNETLFFKGVDGFYAYGGGLPYRISDDLGADYNKLFAFAAGTNGTKYYVAAGVGDMNAMESVDILVFDPRRNMWNREDNHPAIVNFASIGTSLYFLTFGEGENGDGGYIYRICGLGDMNDDNYWEMTEPERRVNWSAETGLIGLDSPFGKYISQIRLRMRLAPGATFRVLVDYDESGRFREIMRKNGTSLRSFNLGLSVERCDTMRLRFEGRTANVETARDNNGFQLFSMSYVVEQGGDV